MSDCGKRLERLERGMSGGEVLEDIGERLITERIRRRFGVERRFERLIDAGAGEDDCAIIDIGALIEEIGVRGGVSGVRGGMRGEIERATQEGEREEKGEFPERAEAVKRVEREEQAEQGEQAVQVVKGYGACGKMVVTTDMLLKSSHFPDGITPFQMGWSAVAVNLSDIAAMGARPLFITVAIGVPSNTRISFFEEILDGIQACADAFGTIVIGGDIVRSNEITLAATCIGFTTREPLKRSGASVGDIVCVTGTLGNAALGMHLVNAERAGREERAGRTEREERAGRKIKDEIAETAKKALFQPYPRVKEGVLIASSGYATSMIDISDGLAISLAEIGRRSGVGFEIWESHLPVSEELRETASSLGLNIHDLVFHFGGDYELLFTLNPKVLEDDETLRMLEKNANMRIIGRVVPQNEGIYLKSDDKKIKIEEIGYQHF